MNDLDRYIIKRTIDATNKVIRFSDTLGVSTITLDEGDYWGYFTTGAEISGKPSLYKEILDKLNAVATDTYTFKLGNPAGDDRGVHHGLVLEKVSGSEEFTWHFSFGSFTLPPEWLGFPSTQSTDVDNVGDRIVSPRAIRGHWISTRKARSKISYARTHIEESTEEVERDDVYQMRWSSRRVRFMEHQREPGVLVHKSRDITHTDAHGLPTGEDNVALEYIWESLSALEEVIIVHDVGGYSDAWDYAVHGDQFEIVKSYDKAQREDFSGVISLSVQHGELYDVSLTLVHTGGTYER
jgi:hypothetical protein